MRLNLPTKLKTQPDCTSTPQPSLNPTRNIEVKLTSFYLFLLLVHTELQMGSPSISSEADLWEAFGGWIIGLLNCGPPSDHGVSCAVIIIKSLDIENFWDLITPRMISVPQHWSPEMAAHLKKMFDPNSKKHLRTQWCRVKVSSN